jgi:type IV secretory pathway TrbD component
VAHVKGSALASRVLWVQLGHGAAGLARLAEALTGELREAALGPLDKARWYPFSWFVELNTAIDQVFGTGDRELVKQLGRFSAEAHLTTIYRLFYKVGTVPWILGRGVRLWSAHYDSGLVEIATRGTRTARLRIHAFDEPHVVHCLALRGWCERSIELSGGKRVTSADLRCRTRGDEHCEMEATWE